MHCKIIIEITKGVQKGQKYEYTEPETVRIGRQDDCDIVLQEKTVSRYHCILRIDPPTVRLHDIGSLNGTYINGKKIGQRAWDTSWEEARNEDYLEFDLHDGDLIRLGKRCELKCSIIQQGVAALKTPDGDCDLFKEEQAKIEQAERENAERNKTEKEILKRRRKQAASKGKMICKRCRKPFIHKAGDNGLCPECNAEHDKKLREAAAKVLGKVSERKEPSEEELPVEGYDKIAFLGKGGMGKVWKVREQKTGKEFALKTMRPEVATDEKSKRMFLREIALCEQLHHNNVVRTYQTGCANDVFYILMELCQGGSVQDLMDKKGGKLSLNLATYIILQALTGLDYVHHLDVNVEICEKDSLSTETKYVKAHGVVHRDFKPGNILLSDCGYQPAAMVADFGTAKAFETAGMTNLTGDKEKSGTYIFMPRQQARDYRFSKPEVDVWAAAASYYYMLTGMPPKNRKQQSLLLLSLVQESAVPILERDPKIPSRIASVIDRALIEEPEIGYKSADAFRRDIIEALPDETIKYCKRVL